QDDADQLSGGVSWEARVAVEGDAVVDVRENGEIAPRHREAGVARAAEEPVELLDLAALALPSHPAALALVPQPLPVEQIEAVVPAAGVTLVERVDPFHRGLDDRGVLGLVLDAGV